MNYRKKANITLIILTIVFVIALCIKKYYGDGTFIDFIIFTVEASLVGGLADWFAVTALFKKPLGFPFHTAIIPRNREKLIDSVAVIIQNEILNVEGIASKIRNLNYTDKLCDKLNEISDEKLKEYIKKQLFDNKAVCKYISAKIDAAINRKLGEQEIKKLIIIASDRLIYSDKFDIVIDIISSELEKYIQQDVVKERIEEEINRIKDEKLNNSFLGFLGQAAQLTNMFNTAEIAATIHMKLIEEANELSLNDTVLHKSFAELSGKVLSESIRGFNSTEVFEGVKEGIIASVPVDKILKEVLESDALLNIIKEVLVNALKSHRERIDSFIADILSDGLKREHDSLGVIVRKTLNSLTDESLNALIEERAGNDLQWIRINGSIVGGFIGMIIFGVFSIIGR